MCLAGMEHDGRAVVISRKRFILTGVAATMLAIFYPYIGTMEYGDAKMLLAKIDDLILRHARVPASPPLAPELYELQGQLKEYING